MNNFYRAINILIRNCQSLSSWENHKFPNDLKKQRTLESVVLQSNILLSRLSSDLIGIESLRLETSPEELSELMEDLVSEYDSNIRNLYDYLSNHTQNKPQILSNSNPIHLVYGVISFLESSLSYVIRNTLIESDRLSSVNFLKEVKSLRSGDSDSTLTSLESVKNYLRTTFTLVKNAQKEL